MSINPYLELRRKIQTPKTNNIRDGRNLYDASTILREATMAKAGQITKLKKAAELGDPKAREILAARQSEFSEQLKQINEMEQLKSIHFGKQIDQLRQCFLKV